MHDVQQRRSVFDNDNHDEKIQSQTELEALQFHVNVSKGEEQYRDIIQELLDVSREKSNKKLTHNVMILDWLEKNYEYKQESYLPRSVLYTHYLDFCKQGSLNPVGAATFGKIIRQKFPCLTTRRLGTRGQSKYHYFGLCIKPSSVYHIKKHCGKGLTRFTTNTKTDQDKCGGRPSKQRVSTVLDGFPKVWRTPGKDLSKNLGKVELFLMMYKAHCQRILESVIGANFEEVETFLLHFWHRMPEHVSKMLDIDAISEVVTACDTIFFKKLIDVLIPDSIIVMPKSFCSEVLTFLKNFLPWLDICLLNAPKKLAAAKMEVAKTYIRLIQRHLSFLQMAKAAREVLSNDDQKLEILEDVEETDFETVLGTVNNNVEDLCRKDSKEKRNFSTYFKDILILLMKQGTVETFVATLDKMMYECVIQPTETSKTDFKRHSADFILKWSQFIAIFMKDLTLRNAESFNSIHLLTVMAMEYIFLVTENKMAAEQEKAIWQKIKSYTFVDKENRGNILKQSLESKRRDRKRQKKFHQGVHQPRRQKQEKNKIEQIQIHYPSGFPEEVNFDYDQAALEKSWESYLENLCFSYANQVTINDTTNNFGNAFGNGPTNYAANSFASRPDCAYDNAGFWTKNTPSFQDLVVNCNWDNMQEQQMTQYYPYLRDCNYNYNEQGNMLQTY